MFGRQISPDGDVVAAARRRLAALAAHHDASEERDTEEHPRTSPVEPVIARHAAVRRDDDPAERGRWGVSGAHLTVAALCVVVLVVTVAWWALRSVPHTQQVDLSSVRVLPTGSDVSLTPTDESGGVSVALLPSSAGPPPQSASARIVVDVAGRVRRPGIVELPSGSRVVDAIAAAGGARPGVGLTSLNLARLLVDGEQIVVGVRVPVFPGAAGPTSAAAPTIAPVSLNSATAEQLDTLPGIGPVTAQAILAWRTDNGPFTSVDDLLEVSGIGDATLADIRPYVYV